MDECLFQDPLPENPCSLLTEWVNYAREHSGQENWNTMMLATVSADGKPGVRAVLHKNIDIETGEIYFYTNYTSRKAQDIASNPIVSVAMHWDTLQRQIRIEGTTVKVDAEISDKYFATRVRESQIGAWASKQSQPLTGGWLELLGRIIEYGTEFAGKPVPRPDFWGGYKIIPGKFEFWHAREGRVHERIQYLKNDDAGDAGGAWFSQWVYP